MAQDRYHAAKDRRQVQCRRNATKSRPQQKSRRQAQSRRQTEHVKHGAVRSVNTIRTEERNTDDKHNTNVMPQYQHQSAKPTTPYKTDSNAQYRRKLQRKSQDRWRSTPGRKTQYREPGRRRKRDYNVGRRTEDGGRRTKDNKTHEGGR